MVVVTFELSSTVMDCCFIAVYVTFELGNGFVLAAVAVVSPSFSTT